HYLSLFSLHPATTQSYTLSLHDALPISKFQAGNAYAISSIRTAKPKLRCNLATQVEKAKCERRCRQFRRRLSLFRTSTKCPKKRSEEHTSELQSRENLVCRLLLEKKKSK